MKTPVVTNYVFLRVKKLTFFISNFIHLTRVYVRAKVNIETTNQRTYKSISFLKPLSSIQHSDPIFSENEVSDTFDIRILNSRTKTSVLRSTVFSQPPPPPQKKYKDPRPKTQSNPTRNPDTVRTDTGRHGGRGNITGGPQHGETTNDVRRNDVGEITQVIKGTFVLRRTVLTSRPTTLS